MKPTDEQQAALALFLAGESMCIDAGAGTGKTSTLRLLAASTRRRGRYMAFSRALVDDAAGSFSGRCDVSTIHGLAMRMVGGEFRHRLGSARMKSWEVAQYLGIDPYVVTLTDGRKKRLAPGWQAGHVLRAVEKFAQSSDAEPTRYHFVVAEGLDLPDAQGRRTYENNGRLAEHLLGALRKAWQDLSSPNGVLPYKHSAYLKFWQLSKPTITADYLLVDEAQDVAPVMADVITRQEHAQIVYVGDANQCQPPGTLVDVVVGRGSGQGRPTVVEQRPIEQLRAGDRVVTYDIARAHLHRRGREIREVAARPYSGDLVVVKVGAHGSRYTPEHRCLVHFKDAFRGRHVVYVMRRGGQYRIGRATGWYDSPTGTGFGPMYRAQAENADALWLLGVYDTMQEANLVESVASWRYGVPSLTFNDHGSRLLDADHLARFWESIGPNAEQASALLAAHGRDVRFPIWRAGQRLHIRRPLVTEACNLMDGMRLLPASSAARSYGKAIAARWWEPCVIQRERYQGAVYSLDVDEFGTYVADGLVTHNSIFRWTGAIDAMESFPAENRSRLSRSFRFGDAIADVANKVLRDLGSTFELLGNPEIDSTVGELDDADPIDALLCRTNASALAAVLDAHQDGTPVHLVGGGKEVQSFARAAVELQAGRSTSFFELSCFDSWGEVQEYVRDDPSGSEIALMVKLIDQFGAQTLLDAVDGTAPETPGTLVVSTAHKSKGRQWPVVRIAGDMVDVEPNDDELRLRYVAFTRARNHLDESAFRAGLAKPVAS